MPFGKELLISAIFPALVLTQQRPSTTASSLTALDAVPACARTCLQNFLNTQFAETGCGASLPCICPLYGKDGYTLGEGAYACARSGCQSSQTSNEAGAAYNVCIGQRDAASPTHSILTVLTPTKSSAAASTAAGSSTNVPTVGAAFTGSSLTGPKSDQSATPTFTSTASKTTTATQQSSVTVGASVSSSAVKSIETGLTAAQLVGVTIAGIAAVTLIIGLILCLTCLRRRRQRREQQDLEKRGKPFNLDFLNAYPESHSLYPSHADMKIPPSGGKDPRGGPGGVGIARIKSLRRTERPLSGGSPDALTRLSYKGPDGSASARNVNPRTIGVAVSPGLGPDTNLTTPITPQSSRIPSSKGYSTPPVRSSILKTPTGLSVPKSSARPSPGKSPLDKISAAATGSPVARPPSAKAQSSTFGLLSAIAGRSPSASRTLPSRVPSSESKPTATSSRSSGKAPAPAAKQAAKTIALQPSALPKSIPIPPIPPTPPAKAIRPTSQFTVFEEDRPAIPVTGSPLHSSRSPTPVAFPPRKQFIVGGSPPRSSLSNEQKASTEEQALLQTPQQPPSRLRAPGKARPPSSVYTISPQMHSSPNLKPPPLSLRIPQYPQRARATQPPASAAAERTRKSSASGSSQMPAPKTYSGIASSPFNVANRGSKASTAIESAPNTTLIIPERMAEPPVQIVSPPTMKAIEPPTNSRPPITTRASRASARYSIGSETSFESLGEDEPSPPEDEDARKQLSPVAESATSLDSPISNLRYPRIPRPASLATSSRPSRGSLQSTSPPSQHDGDRSPRTPRTPKTPKTTYNPTPFNPKTPERQRDPSPEPSQQTLAEKRRGDKAAQVLHETLWITNSNFSSRNNSTALSQASHARTASDGSKVTLDPYFNPHYSDDAPRPVVARTPSSSSSNSQRGGARASYADRMAVQRGWAGSPAQNSTPGTSAQGNQRRREVMPSPTPSQRSGIRSPPISMSQQWGARADFLAQQRVGLNSPIMSPNNFGWKPTLTPTKKGNDLYLRVT